MDRLLLAATQQESALSLSKRTGKKMESSTAIFAPITKLNNLSVLQIEKRPAISNQQNAIVF